MTTSADLLDDKELFLRISQGNETAFERVFHHYTPKLRPFINGIVKVDDITDEILQEVFLKLWLNKENLPYVEHPTAWLYKIASNLSLNQLRRQAAEYKKLKTSFQDSSEEVDSLWQKLSAKELQQLIYEAIQQLPEKRKAIYLLSREEGLTHKQIAEQLDISVNTVKNQVVASLKSIQDHISKKTGIYIPLILLALKINLTLA